MKTRLFSLALLVVCAIFAVSSSEAQDPTATPPTTPVSVIPMQGTRANNGDGFVRVVHASPDAPAVDIYLNGEAAITDFEYLENTDFIPTPADTYTIDVRAAGSDESTAPLFSKDMVVAPGVSITVVALGLLNGTGDSAFNLALLLTERASTKGKARLEVIHAIPDASPVDILSDGEAVLTIVTFGKLADAALNLDSGTYDLTVVPTGSTSSVVLDLSDTELERDTIYTVLAVGLLADGSVEPLILTTTSPEEAMMATPEVTDEATPAATATP